MKKVINRNYQKGGSIDLFGHKINLDNLTHKNAGNNQKKNIYLFFLIHMGIFGLSGFSLAYSSNVNFLFAIIHGGIAIFSYIQFYLSYFGLDEVRNMIINAIVGCVSIYSWMGIIFFSFY